MDSKHSVDLALPVNGSLDRASPAWTSNLLNLYLGTIDVFAKYDVSLTRPRVTPCLSADIALERPCIQYRK